MSFADETDDRQGGMNLDLRYWFWVLRRRFWLFAFVAALLSTAGVGVALVLPPVYEARASLLVESQQIPTDLVRSTVNASAVEQIEVIKQRLLTREVLLALAERHRVFAADPDMPAADRVWRMKDAISFDTRILGQNRRNETVSTALSIAFTADAGTKAAGVVNDLVTEVLSQSAELRRNRAETTTDYFRQEVESLSRELAQMEGRIIAFQKENEQALPESLEYRRSQLDLLQERLQRFELERIDLQQERTSLEMVLGEDAPAAQAEPLSESARELATLQRELLRRGAILSESHPEIQEMRSAVRALEAVVAAEAEGTLPTAAPSLTRDAESAARRELRRRFSLVEARLAFNEEVIAELAAERDRLERSLLETPNIQMDLNNLQRTYEALEGRYETARSKLAEAEAGEQLEDKQQGERFEVIEQATVPEEPIKPSRKKLAAAGVGGGVGAGLGLIVLLEMMSSVVRRPEDLARIDREPVAVIPYISTPGERRRLWAFRIFSFLVIVGGGATALWALHAWYLPLETILDKILEKSGLDEALDMVRRRFGAS